MLFEHWGHRQEEPLHSGSAQRRPDPESIRPHGARSKLDPARRSLLLAGGGLALGAALLVSSALWADAEPRVHDASKDHGGMLGSDQGSLLAERDLERYSEWPAGPHWLPRGARMSPVRGDPEQEGAFAMHLKLPELYFLPPHSQPRDLFVTVLEGSLHIAAGEIFDPLRDDPLEVGDLAHLPAAERYHAWTRGPAVILLEGIGPWEIEYADPADDPRLRERRH